MKLIRDRRAICGAIRNENLRVSSLQAEPKHPSDPVHQSATRTCGSSIVRKHAGRQRTGWRFDFRHLHGKSASLSPFKRFAFELRDLARRQPLPGYRLGVERDRAGRELLVFARGHLSTGGCGQVVDAGISYNNVTLSGSGAKTIGASITTLNSGSAVLSINGTATASVANREGDVFAVYGGRILRATP